MSHIHILNELPNHCYLALSGGPDSMAALDFLIKGGRDVIALHYNHGTSHGQDAEEFVTNYCRQTGIKCVVGNVSSFRERNPNESPEEYWRNARYEFFKGFDDRKIVMAHNLDDQVENFLFSSIRNGNSTLIPYEREIGSAIVIRPFLLTKKANLEGWCKDKDVPFVIDPGNHSNEHMRSFIRMNMVPQALNVNPGLYKMIKKKMLSW